jgi:hypothetical protein
METREGSRSDEVRLRTTAVREAAERLSSYDLEKLEADLKVLERETAGLRELLGGEFAGEEGRRFRAASPTTDSTEKTDTGPAISSDPSAIG